MRIHQSPAVLLLLGLALIAPTVPTASAAAMLPPMSYQVAEPPPGEAQTAAPPEGAAYTNISPDGTCASGFTAFVVARGVQECYTPDPVVENENLQNTCPTDPTLFICPGQED